MVDGTSTEARLCAICAELLGVDRVGIDDDFLDLGGDSFLATRLIGRIRTEFGRSLELPDFFENPTVRSLAALIEGDTKESRFRRLVPLRYDREKPPTHTFEGSFVFAFATTRIMERLGLRFPVYAVTIDWRLSELDYSEGVQELARYHVAELLQVDPVGPYRLAGFSFGGIIAYEMACQIRSKGRPVECLLLLDARVPFDLKKVAPDTAGTVEGAEALKRPDVIKVRRKSSLQRFLEAPMMEKPGWIWQRRRGFTLYTLRAIARVVRALVIRGLWPQAGVPVSLRKEWALLYKEAIWKRYQPGAYDGEMIYFGARDHIDQARAYWSNLVTGRLDFRPVPVVEHDDVVADPESVRLIRDCFDELLGPVRTGRSVSEVTPGDHVEGASAVPRRAER